MTNPRYSSMSWMRKLGRALSGEAEDREDLVQQMRQALEDATVESINSVLAEDIRDLLFVDAKGKPCIETKTTQDLEDALGLPGGNIFHAPLSWPYAAAGADCVLVGEALVTGDSESLVAEFSRIAKV